MIEKEKRFLSLTGQAEQVTAEEFIRKESFECIDEEQLNEIYKAMDDENSIDLCWETVIKLETALEAVEIKEKEFLNYKKFYEHIKGHFKEAHPDWQVVCKICYKSFEEITK